LCPSRTSTPRSCTESRRPSSTGRLASNATSSITGNQSINQLVANITAAGGLPTIGNLTPIIFSRAKLRKAYNTFRCLVILVIASKVIHKAT